MLPIVTTLISAFKDPILAIAADAIKEVDFFMDDGLSSYVESQRQKYIKTKTFLSNNELVDFYDIYFPISLQFRKGSLETNEVSELFKDSNCVAIIGSAGSGKTTLSKHCFLNCIDTLYKIPIVIELRNLNNSTKNLNDYLKEIITINRLSISDNILERILQSGNFLFIFDGYDEIFSINKSKLESEIDIFIDVYYKNNFIITSRPNAGAESFPRFENHGVLPLNLSQIKQFVSKQLSNGFENQALAFKIIKTIEKPENNSYVHYLDNPLLLSMFILTYNSYPELPNNKAKFFWNVFNTLSTKHDAITKRGTFQRERKSNLNIEDIEKVLKWFSYLSLFQGKFNFDSQYFKENLNLIKQKLNISFVAESLIEDLSVSLSIIILDGIEYTFPHKSFQEYFAAKLISEQADDHKIKIYSEKIPNSIQYLPGGNDSFWSLCIELDKIYFYSYYVIPTLKNYLSIFIDNDYFKSYSKFVLFHQIRERAKKSDEIYIIKGGSSIRTLHINLLRFFGIKPTEDLYYNNPDRQFEIKSKYNDAVLEMINSGQKNITDVEYEFSIFEAINYPSYCGYLEIAGLEKSMSKFVESMKNLIARLESEIKIENENKKSLLFL